MAKKYFCMVLPAIFAVVSLYAQSESDFTVQLNDAGDGVVITKYTGKIINVVIPATIQGLPVYEIGDNAFAHLFYASQGISTITLPSTLKTIGTGAFRRSSLTKISIPDSVDKLGDSAFFESNVSEVKLSKSLIVIPDYAFGDCENLANITLPEGLQEIGSRAFSSTKLTKLVLPKSIKTIGFQAFAFC